jgi:hypothetical protein
VVAVANPSEPLDAKYKSYGSLESSPSIVILETESSSTISIFGLGFFTFICPSG